jgi:hypothetical protein
MVVPVCLSVYHVYRADGSLRERALSCHAKPYHVGFQASLLELWPGLGTALRGLTRRIDIIVRGSPRLHQPLPLPTLARCWEQPSPACCGPAAAALLLLHASERQRAIRVLRPHLLT